MSNHGGTKPGSNATPKPRATAVRHLLSHAVLGATCSIVYLVMTMPALSIFPETQQARAVGAIWAVVATIFVFKETTNDSLRVSTSRVIATMLSFALCEIYLLIFPFTAWGLGLVIAVGGIAATLLRRLGDAGVAAITSSVILIVASIGPRETAWQQPILRLVDTIVGVAAGFLAATAWSAVHRNPSQST